MSVAAGNADRPHDMWITVHALALDARLVNANEREFCRVAGVRVENWTV